MKKSLLLSISLIFLFLPPVFSQKSKTKGLDKELLNYGAMKEGKDVKGYYFFYKVDKADKKNNNYEVQIFDNSFNEVNNFELVKPTYYNLKEATFNGDAFLFLFLDSKERKEDMILFDKTGKEVKDVSSEKMDAAEYMAMSGGGYKSKANDNIFINALPGKGFLKFDVVKNKKEGKTGYVVSLYDNTLKKIWTIGTPASSQHKFESFQTVYYDYKYLIGVAMGKDKLAGTDFTYDIVLLDLQNGKLISQTSLKDKRYSVTPSGAFYDSISHQFVLLGEYQDAQAKIAGKSNGIVMLSYDESGKPLAQKYLTWDKDISKFLSIDSKGKIENGGYLGFEKMFATSDGKIFAIAEQYKKAASAMGIAGAILSGGRSVGPEAVVNIELMDLMVFEFSSDFTLTGISSFNKPDHRIELPGTLGYFPLNVISLVMKGWGLFDYNFLTQSNDQKTFSINYNIAGKKKDEGIQIGNLVYTPEGKFVESNLAKKDIPNLYAVLPAKWGYIGIMEYDKKQKEITQHIEKLDY